MTHGTLVILMMKNEKYLGLKDIMNDRTMYFILAIDGRRRQPLLFPQRVRVQGSLYLQVRGGSVQHGTLRRRSVHCERRSLYVLRDMLRMCIVFNSRANFLTLARLNRLTAISDAHI